MLMPNRLNNVMNTHLIWNLVCNSLFNIVVIYAYPAEVETPKTPELVRLRRGVNPEIAKRIYYSTNNT